MKKIFFIVLLALSISAFGYSLTYAASVDAVIIEDSHCVLGQDASGLAISLRSEDTFRVKAKKGKVKSVCHFNVPEGYESQIALSKEGFSCKISKPGKKSVMTTDTNFSYETPGGKAVLTCKYKNDS